MVKRNRPTMICDECGEAIKGGKIKRHKAMHEKNKKKALERTCEVCKKVFAKKCNLARHRDSGACKSGASFQPHLEPHFSLICQNHKGA